MLTEILKIRDSGILKIGGDGSRRSALDKGGVSVAVVDWVCCVTADGSGISLLFVAGGPISHKCSSVSIGASRISSVSVRSRVISVIHLIGKL